MKILALTRYGTRAASTRQRFTQYEPALRAAGFEVDYQPLLDNDYVQGLAKGASSRSRVVGGYLRRLRKLLQARRYDILWVHCELFPYLPGLFEALLAKAAHRPIIFDYDDAIFHIYDENPNPLVRRLLGKKLQPLLRRAAACACGNEYLRSYAARFCRRSVVIPTIVDTSIYRPRARQPENGPPVIGWIGSPSTWCNVQPILPLLQRLATAGARVRVVGAGPGAERDSFPGLEVVEWTEEAEVEEVRNMDIGIMPLLDRPFQRGKSGYKLIQYMACGLPVVASPIGVNAEIVGAENGFLATAPEEWEQALTRLLADPVLRERMGSAGRERAVRLYSLEAQAPRLVELFRACEAEATAR